MSDQTALIQQLLARIDRLENENALLKEQNASLMKKLYGRSTETSTSLGLPMDEKFFCDVSDVAPNGAPTQPTAKKKFKGQRQQKFARLPREKQLYRLKEEKQFCPKCSKPLNGIGESFVRSEVVFIPARLKVIDVYRESYECRCCKKGTSSSIYKALTPSPVIPHSYASASAIAQVIVQKFVQAVPLYRQETSWEQTGLTLKRQTMSNWLLHVAEDYLQPLVERLHCQLLKERYLHADETRIEVLNEPKRKNTTNSYMWLYSTKQDSLYPIRIFEYTETRNGDHAKKFLTNFHGYLVSDAYMGYEKVDNIQRCYCWSHLRRYFVEALPANHKVKAETLAGQAIHYCGQLFQLENEWKDLSPEERIIQRQLEAAPLLKQFWDWVDQHKEECLPKSKLFKAFQYALNQKEGLCQFLIDGNIAISNNLAENSIRPFTIGRKNWLFSGSPKGAKASAAIYSLVETAKANGLNIYRYFEHLFTQLAGSEKNSPELLDRFLPWTTEIQEQCVTQS